MLHKPPEFLARLLIDGNGDDPEFADAWDEAHENAVDPVESTIYQQAVGGNTLAAIFYLKAHRPIYRDRLNIDIEQVRGEIKERMAQLGVTPHFARTSNPGADRVIDHQLGREVDLAASEATGKGCVTL
jgi:hypothetical protein